MTRPVLWLTAFLVAAPAVRAAPSPAAAEVAAAIDRRLDAAWAEKGVKPAPAADDSEFLRRVYLDLAGRIPTVSEARAFLADDRPDKRRHLAAELLARPTYARHATDVWKALLLPESGANIQGRFLIPGMEAWLRKQFDENAPYDKMVREVLTTPITAQTGRPVFARTGNPGEPPSPIAFYQAKEGKPENLTAATARLFLGVRLECAQCHDHPFADWKRDQFWGLAAFFAGVRGRDQGNGFTALEGEALDRRELEVPNTNRVVQATFPDGADPQWKPKTSGRQTLADWLTAKDNPFFARAAVNRVWASFFGSGLIDPVDEMVGGQDTVVHHEALLAELAKAFADGGYDLKRLTEGIVASRAYQLTSAGGPGAAPLFSRHPVRGLTPEQLFDSLAAATGFVDPQDVRGATFFNPNSARGEFLSKFAQAPGKATEQETSIVQALTLMNGRTAAAVTDPDRGELLGAVLDAPFLDTPGRIEALYLAALSRPPKAKELERAVAFVEKAAADGPTDTARQRRAREAVADVFWALLNSGEFILNH